jgi:saccharopine dehydrogenase-like NADP-dependent oxidoreductase
VNLAKDFAAAGNKPLRCHTCRALATLDAADRDALQAAIDNRDLSVRVIVDVCAKNGINVNTNSIYEHRQGRCPKP